jgi:adenosylcobinamide kinase/adenosylcobinamide-phosphate guanylyltransferase
MKVLVTGGVRSGKSRHAEELVSSGGAVTYVALGPTPQEERDADWTQRIAIHRARRPRHWATLETDDLAQGLAVGDAVLVDCLGTWVARVLDREALWDSPTDEVHAVVQAALDRALDVLNARTTPCVIVTNEVGLGVVPEHRSGRLFRDLLGTVNQQIAAVCDQVHLVVAGRVLIL